GPGVPAPRGRALPRPAGRRPAAMRPFGPKRPTQSLSTRPFVPEWPKAPVGEGLAELRTRGRWPPPAGPRVAVVGSRRPSPYGEAVAEQLGLELARAGVVVISGLA